MSYSKLFIDCEQSLISRLRFGALQNIDRRHRINLIDGMRMRGEILKNASLSSAADKTLGHPTNDTRAGINKVNLNNLLVT